MGLIRANNALQNPPVVPQKAAQAHSSSNRAQASQSPKSTQSGTLSEYRQKSDDPMNIVAPREEVATLDASSRAHPRSASYGATEVAEDVFLALTTLQHRGQDAAGIASYQTPRGRAFTARDADLNGERPLPPISGGGFRVVKNIGLVDAVFNRENIARLTGEMALGHTRYSTAGDGDLGEVQPMVISYPFGIALVHNGNIVNTEQLARELREQSRRHLLTTSDTEIILNLFAEGLAGAAATTVDERLTFEQIVGAARTVFRRAEGSYSIVAMIAGNGMVAFRDPQGIRPLTLGRRGTESSSSAEWMLASESATLSFLGFEHVRDIEPGEVVWISPDGMFHAQPFDAPDPRPCMFEWVYFASPESIIDGANVYAARIGLGKTLAQTIRAEIDSGRMKPDIVVPVPETARIAAIALAEELALPYREVLIKNRYVQRSFILDSQAKRQRAVHLKLSPVRTEIEGKRVLLVDDSIVRGTTSRKLIDLVRKAGAKKVYFVSSCPPIRYPCFYGIDFPDRDELIAHNRTLPEIEKELGADAVVYQPIEGLRQAISSASLRTQSGPSHSAGRVSHPCMACLDGCYLTPGTTQSSRAPVKKGERQ